MRTARIAVGLAAVAALALAAGCRKPEEAPAKRGPAPIEAAEGVPADAAAPLTFSEKSAHAEVSLNLPEALKRQPDLHARLYSEGVKGLKQFVEGAVGERAEMEAQGVELPPYSRTVAWTVEAETPKLLSLISMTDEYTGGAHGNHVTASVLWDKALKRQIALTALFRPGSEAQLEKLVCDALTAEKKARTGAAFTPPGQDWNCPKLKDVTLALAASTTAGKSAGLKVLADPYLIGPYAEGGYEAVVPFSAFAALLAPAYADEFGGAPKPAAKEPAAG